MIYFAAAMSCVAFAIAVFWGYARYARLDMRRLTNLEIWSDSYFRNAEIFIANAGTPTTLLEDILALNHSIDNPKASHIISDSLERIIVDRIKADNNTNITATLDFLRRENLIDAYRELARSYILTISFKDMVRGPRIRELLTSAEAIAQNQKKTTSANAELFVGVILEIFASWRGVFITPETRAAIIR